MQCFRQSADELGIGLRVIAGDACPELSAACHLADQSHLLPRCDTDQYIDSVLQICRTESVDILIPTIDPELQPYAQYKSLFAEHGISVIVSDLEAIQIARDKQLTAENLDRYDVPVPKTWSVETLPPIAPENIILKPRSGSSSVGLFFVQNGDPIPPLKNPATYIAQERLSGQEFTINCFVSQEGQLLAAVPHLRIETRGGEVSKGRTVALPSLQTVAQQITHALPTIRGPFCFQAFVKDGQTPIVFEINARFGGGYPLAHQAGATFTRWILEEKLGQRPSPLPSWTSDLTMLRYDNAVFY